MISSAAIAISVPPSSGMRHEGDTDIVIRAHGDLLAANTAPPGE